MEEEQSVTVTLPEEIVGRILAMVPFPQIFQARVLSKSWQAKFSPISSLDNENERHLATWFQEQVVQRSSKWKTFYHSVISRKDMNSYDRASHHWQRMPSLSFLPEQIFKGRLELWMEGALLLVNVMPVRNASLTSDFYVANILTRTWKLLPPQRHVGNPKPHFLIYTKPTYRVVNFEEDWGADHFFAHTYDSNLEAWSSTKITRSNEFSRNLSSWTRLDGVLYRVVGPSSLMAGGLHAFNVKEGTFETLKMSSSFETPAQQGVELVVCNESLLMIIYDPSSMFRTPESVIVVKADLGSRRWLQLTEGPPADLNFGGFNAKAEIDGDCLVFAGQQEASRVIAYNVQKDEWSRSPRSGEIRRDFNTLGTEIFDPATAASKDHGPFSFQPGLNPFATVSVRDQTVCRGEADCPAHLSPVARLPERPLVSKSKKD